MPDNSSKSPRSLLIGLAGTLWLVAALVGYYYAHKPFEIAFLSNALIAIWRFVITVGIITLSGGIGAWLLSKKVGIPPLTSLALQSALGGGILGLFILFMGMTIGFRTYYFVVLILAVFILLRKNILTWLRQWVHLKSCFTKNGLLLTLAISSGLVLLWTLAFALAPPLRFDALTYHLALPRLYLLNGNIAYTPDNMFWGMPQQAEMLYAFAMALGGTEAAVTLGWGFGVLTLIGLLGYVKDKISLTAGWIAITCLLGGNTLAKSLSFGYTEWLVMLNGLVTLIVLNEWRTSAKQELLLLAGCFAGFALGTKYTAGQLILIGLIVIAWEGVRQKNRRALINLLIFGGTAALISLPWWLKNWLGTSNPFYPLLWPAGAMTQARLDHYTGTPWGSWLDMLILPWQVTVWGVEGGQGFSWSIGPLLLGFGALSLIGWQTRGSEQKRLLSTAAIATITGFVIWAFVSRWNGLLIQTRLYAAFFPAWAILSGFGFDSLANLRAAGIRFGRLAAAMLLLALTFNLIEIGKDASDKAPFAVLTGSMTPASYRARNLGGYEVAMAALEELPPNARVLMLWETRSLACLSICDPDEVIDRWYDDSLKYASADDVLATWGAQGYTHLLLNNNGREFVQENDGRISPENWTKLQTLLNNLPAPESIAPGYELYKLYPQ